MAVARHSAAGDPLVESGPIAIGIVVFLAFTALQSAQTTAKLSLFTNKLGLAILLAALIRVHQGWPAAMRGSPISSVYSEGFQFWQNTSQLTFYLAPLALLAANFGYRSNGRKSVAMTALMGIAVPLAGTLLLVGIIRVATFHSGFHVPSLQPNVAMALWSHAATSALPGRMLLAAITAFGAMRFGIRSLVESASIRPLGRLSTLALLGCLAGLAVWCSVTQYSPILDKPFELVTNCLAVTAAVLTADFVTRSWRVDRVRRFDWIGVIALIAGLAAPLCLPVWIVGKGHDTLLPSYGIGLAVCLLGRTMQQIPPKTVDAANR